MFKIERFYEVHVPRWKSDSMVGQYPNLELAREDAYWVRNGGAQIYRHTFIRLPFGWHLERVIRLTDWERIQP